MLKDNNDKKPDEIALTEELQRETIKAIREGILKKLASAKKLLNDDREVSAGLYIYAVEEFGKLLLIEESHKHNNKFIIKYRNEFLNHNVKFGKALDYLQEHRYNQCIILNDEGGFSPEGFSWRGFSIGLLPKTEARLGIFYTDFIYSQNGNNNISIMKVPVVDENILRKAIDELENVINQSTTS